MKISINDYANNRVIIAEVPEYITSVTTEGEEIADAIFNALGFNSDECDYMIGDFNVNADLSLMDQPIDSLEDLSQNFKEDALLALGDAD